MKISNALACASLLPIVGCAGQKFVRTPKGGGEPQKIRGLSSGKKSTSQGKKSTGQGKKSSSLSKKSSGKSSGPSKEGGGQESSSYRVIHPECPGVCLGTDSNTHTLANVDVIEELAMIHCDYSGMRDKWHKLEQGDLFKLRHAEEQMCISSPPNCFESINEPTAGGLPQTLVDCDSAEAALFVAGLDPSNPHHLFHSDCWFFNSQSIILSDFSSCGAEDSTDVQWTPQRDGSGQRSPGENNWIFLEVMGDENRMYQETINDSDEDE